MLDLATIGIAMDTSGLEKGAAALKNTEQAAGKAADAADRFSSSSKVLSGEQKSTADATEKVRKSINDQISSLRTQAETFGMSARQATVYKLAMDGATESQKKQADAAIKQVESLQAARDMGEQAGKAIKAGALLAAAGVVAATVAFEKLIGNVAKYQDLAEQTGADPAGLASLRTAADVGGASIESLVMAANRMQKSLAGVDDESKGVGKALAAIGLHVEEFKKLRADEQIREIAKALDGYADGGAKVAVLQAIMGRGAASLLPALKELGVETEKQNGLTNEQIRLADDYKDAQARAKSELMQFAEGLAVTALPVVTEFIGALKSTVTELFKIKQATGGLTASTDVKEFAQSAAVFLANVADLAYVVGQAFNYLGNNIAATAAQGLAIAKLDFSGAGAIGRASIEFNENLKFSLGLADKLQAKFDAVDSKAASVAAKFKDPRVLGEVGSIADQSKKNIDYSTAKEKAATKAVTEKVSAYEKLIKTLGEKTAMDQLDIQTQGALTAGQKEAVKIMDDIRTGVLKFVAAKGQSIDAQKRALTAAIEARLATEQQKNSIEKLTKADLEAAQAHNKYIESLQSGVSKLQAEVTAQQELNDRLGLTKEAIVLLDAAKLEDKAITLDMLAIKALDRNSDEITYNLYKAQANELRNLAALKRDGAYKEARIESAKAAEKAEVEAAKAVFDEWKKGWEATDSLARDAFTSWATDGSSAAKKIGDSLKKALLSAIYEATLKPVAFQIYNAVTGGAPGGSQSGGLGNIASMSGPLTGYSSSVNTAAGWLGAGTTAGASTASLAYGDTVGALGGDALGAMIAGNASWGGVTGAATAAQMTGAASAASVAAEGAVFASSIGQYAVAAEAGTAALAAASATGTAATVAGTAATTGLTAALAAIPVWGWVALGAAVLLGSAGGGFKSSASTGSSASNFDASGKMTDYNTAYGGSNAATDKVVVDLQSKYTSLAAAIGIKTVATSFNYGGNTGAEGENPQFALGGSAGGKTFYQGETKLSDEAVKLAASRAVFAALQGSDLPQYLAKMFDNLNASELSGEQISATLEYAAGLTKIREALLETRAPIEILKDNLAKGNAALKTSADTFKTDFVAAIDAGISPATLSQWQGLQATMEQLAQASGTADTALGKVSRSLSDIANERARLQDQYDQLTLSSVQMLAKQRAAIDESNQGLFDQVQAQVALKDAATQAADAARATAEAYLAAVQAERAAAAQRLGLAGESASNAFAGVQRAVAAQKAQEQAAFNASKEAAAAIYKAQSTSLKSSFDSARASLDAINGSVSKLRSLSGTLKGTLDGLRIIGSEGSYRADAQGQISAALAKARSGGGLPTGGQLDSALKTISQPSEQLFSSFTDYARDFYRAANDIAALSDLTDAQLTADEITQGILKDQSERLAKQQEALKDGFSDQVSALEDILTNAQRQLDAANGINTSVLSVAAALALFKDSIIGLTTERAKQDLPTSRGSSYTPEQIGSAAKQSIADGYSVANVYDGAAANFGIRTSEVTAGAKAAGLSGFNRYSDSQILSAINASLGQGFSVADVYTGASKNFDISNAEIMRIARAGGVPGFAGGGDFGGGLRMVGERGPELEATGPSRIFNASQTRGILQGGNDTARLEALIEKLTEKVAALQESSERGNAEIKRGSDALNGRQGVPILVTVTA